MSRNGKQDVRIAIIGAGPGGICMGIKLKEAGFDDFVVLEKGDGLGGTWYHNRYPGCECDIASHLYSYSFEIKTDWSKPFGPQPEILAYVQHCAEKYGVLPHCKFNATVRSVTWNDDTSMWSVEQESGETVEANIVVSAIGMFNRLVYPDIEGLDSFAGTSFHSARWNWDHDLEGKTVGVIGKNGGPGSPATLKIASIGPPIASIAAWMESGRRRSTSRLFATETLVGFTSSPITSASMSTRICAVASPMPDADPVTTTRLSLYPSTSSIICVSSGFSPLIVPHDSRFPQSSPHSTSMGPV